MTYSEPEYVRSQYRDPPKLYARTVLRVPTGLTGALDREPASLAEVRITKDTGLYVARR